MKITAVQQDIISVLDTELVASIKQSLLRDKEFFTNVIKDTIGERLWSELKQVLHLFRNDGKLKKRFSLKFTQPVHTLRIIFSKLFSELDEEYFS